MVVYSSEFAGGLLRWLRLLPAWGRFNRTSNPVKSTGFRMLDYQVALNDHSTLDSGPIVYGF